MRQSIGTDLFRRFAFNGKGVISIVLGKLGYHAQLGANVSVSRFGVGNVTVGAVLYPLLQIHKIPAAFVAKGIQRAATKHTVEIVTAYFMAGKIFTGIVFKIGTVVFHSLSPNEILLLPPIILHLPYKKQGFQEKFLAESAVISSSPATPKAP